MELAGLFAGPMRVRFRDGLLSNGVSVVVVVFGLRHQEDLFMSLGGPVSYAFWHRVGFVPDDLGSQVESALVAQFERHLPRNTDEVFPLQRALCSCRKAVAEIEPH